MHRGLNIWRIVIANNYDPVIVIRYQSSPEKNYKNHCRYAPDSRVSLNDVTQVGEVVGRYFCDTKFKGASKTDI